MKLEAVIKLKYNYKYLHINLDEVKLFKELLSCAATYDEMHFVFHFAISEILYFHFRTMGAESEQK